jgi:two-component system CheB/CheR fusion protein
MNSGVAVVVSDMKILAWNAKAEDLWGVRADEALGRHLLNLDIGLPLDGLRQPLRKQLDGADVSPEMVVLDAVNRRGRALQIRVTLTHIADSGDSLSAALLAMDVVDNGGN